MDVDPDQADAYYGHVCQACTQAEYDEYLIEQGKAEREAEMAIEHYYEGGWDVTGEYTYDPYEAFA